MEKYRPFLYIPNWTFVVNFSDSIKNNNFSMADIIVTKDCLYIIGISMPVYVHILTRLLGVLGAFITSPIRKKSLLKSRSSWVDSDGNFISDKYKELIILKIEKDSISDSLDFNKRLEGTVVIIKYEGQQLTIKNTKYLQDKLKWFLGHYVNIKKVI